MSRDARRTGASLRMSPDSSNHFHNPSPDIASGKRSCRRNTTGLVPPNHRGDRVRRGIGESRDEDRLPGVSSRFVHMNEGAKLRWLVMD